MIWHFFFACGQNWYDQLRILLANNVQEFLEKKLANLSPSVEFSVSGFNKISNKCFGKIHLWIDLDVQFWVRSDQIPGLLVPMSVYVLIPGAKISKEYLPNSLSGRNSCWVGITRWETMITSPFLCPAKNASFGFPLSMNFSMTWFGTWYWTTILLNSPQRSEAYLCHFGWSTLDDPLWMIHFGWPL